MFEALIQGVLWGLLLSVLIGPVFFLIIKTSLEKGIKQAITLDIGVVVGDVFAIIVAYMGMAAIFQNPLYQKWLGIVGGSILMIFGISPLLRQLKKSKEITTDTSVIEIQPTANAFWLAMKGFFLNLSNPFVWLYWTACVGVAVSQFKGNGFKVLLFFIACICTFFGIDVVKIYLANKIRSFLTIQRLRQINNVASIAIIVFGIILIYRVLNL